MCVAALVLISAVTARAEIAWTTCRSHTCAANCSLQGLGNPPSCGPQCCAFSRKEKRLRSCVPSTCGTSCSSTEGRGNPPTCGPRCCQRFWWFQGSARSRKPRPLVTATSQKAPPGPKKVPSNMRYDARYPGVLLSQDTLEQSAQLATKAQPQQTMATEGTRPRRQQHLTNGVLTFNVCGGLTNQRLAIIDGLRRRLPAPPMSAPLCNRVCLMHPLAPRVWQG